jgi:hypothetical protein
MEDEEKNQMGFRKYDPDLITRKRALKIGSLR